MGKKAKASITNQLRAKQLAKVRNKKGLTQQQVADLVNLSLKQYQKYEGGSVMIDENSVQIFADRLEVSADHLLCYTDDPNGDPIEKSQMFSFNSENTFSQETDYKLLELIESMGYKMSFLCTPYKELEYIDDEKTDYKIYKLKLSDIPNITISEPFCSYTNKDTNVTKEVAILHVDLNGSRMDYSDFSFLVSELENYIKYTIKFSSQKIFNLNYYKNNDKDLKEAFRSLKDGSEDIDQDSDKDTN